MSLRLLHGFTGGPRSWEHLSPWLTSPCHALTIGGHNATPCAPSFEEEADRLADQHPGAGHWVGYSLGGRLALSIAMRHPQRVSALTLISANAGVEPEHRQQRLRSDMELADNIERLGVPWFVDYWASLPIWASQKGLEPLRAQEQRQIRLAHSARGLAQALRVLGLATMPSYWDELANLRCPVQVIVGSLDSKYQAIARRMKSVLPQIQLSVLPKAGHNPLVEQPQALASILGSLAS